jgi:CcmD family protein
MNKVLLWNMLAFVLFSMLIAWFRYDLERTSQKINALHIKKASQGSMAMTMLAPAMLLFADDKLLREKTIQHHYMVAGYIAVWTVYIGYLLFLFAKLQRLKREGQEVGL